MWRCGLPLGAHPKFSWLVLPVYAVVCSELDEGVQDLVGSGYRAWWSAPTRGQRPYFALASGVTGVNRLTSPPSGSPPDRKSGIGRPLPRRSCVPVPVG